MTPAAQLSPAAGPAALELPARIENETQLEEVMTRPSEALVAAMRRLDGDLIILGVAGKMGPTLARLARRACEAAGVRKRIIGVARFSDPRVKTALESNGVETLEADLMRPGALEALPGLPNVIYLVGRKFGATGDQPLTWAVNTWLPARVAERFRNARIVALSTGNVYPLTPVDGPGPTEDDPTGPVGEYAQSCLGRERMFQYFSTLHATPTTIIRLNYAIDLRYGVLLDIARKVWTGTPVPLAMGHANVIWQGDANEAVLRALEHAASPPFILNLTGLETLSVRALAEAFGRRFDKQPRFDGQEAPTALLNNAARYGRLFGGPRVSLDRMIDWVAHWVRIDGPTWDKPTHFETRDGKF